MDPKQRMIRRDFDLVFDGVKLKAYTKTIDGKEYRFIGGTASSNAKDLYGDVITPEGQVMMLTKLRHLAEEMKGANSGLTGWLNHRYKIPEDTLGAFVDAQLSTRTGDGIDGEKGAEYIDLDIELRLVDPEANPRALAAWKQVQDGIRHGWSIGAYFTDCEWASDDPDSPDFWSLRVTGVNLLEISLVGIPANQRAWCRSAEDAKERAVKIAEDIVREAHAKKGADRAVLRDKSALRGMVLKSLVHDGVADSTSTSPIVSREAGDSLPLFQQNASDELNAEETETEVPAEVQADADVTQTTDAPAETVQASGEAATQTTEEDVTLGGDENVEVRNGDPQEPSEPAEPQAASTLSVERPDGNIPGLLAANEILCKTAGVVLAAVIDGDEWVGTEVRSAHIEGEEIKVGEVVKNADEVGASFDFSKVLNLEAQTTEIAQQLNARAEGDNEIGEESKTLMQQAAGAIDVLTAALNALDGLTKRDADGDTPSDQVALAIGHVAKAVGHGVCVRSAKHLSEALACLSAAVGATAQPGPGGDEDNPDESLAAQVSKLEPKAGDIIIARGSKFKNSEQFRSAWDALNASLPEGVTAFFVNDDLFVAIDNDLGEKAKSLIGLNEDLSSANATLTEKSAELATVESSLTEKSAALADTESKLADAQKQLEEIETKVKEISERRVGRNSPTFDVNAMLEARTRNANTSEVKPEDYQRNSADQRKIINKQMSGDAQATSGRDLVV